MAKHLLQLAIAKTFLANSAGLDKGCMSQQEIVEGNIFVTERCELHGGCTLRGDIEAPRLVVNNNVTFLGSAKVGTGKSLPA